MEKGKNTNDCVNPALRLKCRLAGKDSKFSCQLAMGSCPNLQKKEGVGADGSGQRQVIGELKVIATLLVFQQLGLDRSLVLSPWGWPRISRTKPRGWGVAWR